MRRSLVLSLASLLLVPAFISCGGDDIPSTPRGRQGARRHPLQPAAPGRAAGLQAGCGHRPITPDFVYSGALHFHQDAKAQGMELTPEEIKGLGIEHLAAKLDNLSGSPSDDYPVKDARLAFNAGIYRLTKGLTAKSWAKMKHMGITDNNSARQHGSTYILKDMALGFDGKKILTVTCVKKPDGNFGISFMRFEIAPKNLKQD
ncbi:MAG: hypothetical protein IPP58_12160 [Holophagaceae bacterium]|uniref:Uncharacterized protein n=1 Tax=Candidatus Geothrix skivensis TaxID=2954439 RepID=A0A9D7SI40_9BACT|nr:hypothetical protein [Candidatus Geothrix skivensis]